MGTRKDPKQTQTQNSTTNFQGAFMSSPLTPEEQELKDFDFDQSRYSAGQAATFGKARQDIVEGTGGYAGITNPVLAARIQQIGLEELADQESSAKAAAERERNQMGLQNKQFLAGLRRPQYIQTGATSSGTGTSVQQNQGNLLASIIGGGLGLAGAFA
jgi:hypothetical protein